MFGFARMCVSAVLTGLFGKTISVVVDHLFVNAPDWMHLGRVRVVVSYEEGGETKTQEARFPFVWLARKYVTALKGRWGAKKPRCVIEMGGEVPQDKLPLHQPRLYLGHAIVC